MIPGFLDYFRLFSILLVRMVKIATKRGLWSRRGGPAQGKAIQKFEQTNFLGET